jgi:hypothetical protein
MTCSKWASPSIYVRMANLDFEVCDGKTFRDLCKDVLDRSQSKKDQLDTLFSDCRGHIKNVNDAAVFLPRLKELLEVGIKNDEQNIKLIAILQKLQSTQLETSGGEDGILSDADKEQLLQNVAKEQLKDIKKTVDSNDIPKDAMPVPHIIS